MRRKVSRKAIILTLVPLCLVAWLVGWGALQTHKFRLARDEWKTKALRILAQTSLNNEQVQLELERIKHPTSQAFPSWTGDQVILMTNGEYLVYAYWHALGGANHLFLARGTDGKWYYSTYHFCNSMCALMHDEPAGSLGEFAQRYAVREFDGKSDECLKRTWPAKR